MYPQAVPLLGLAAHRSLRVIEEAMGETERALFGQPSGPRDANDLKRRTAVTSWSGDTLPLGTRVGEVPDPGVILGLLYEGPTSSATLPVDVFAQTLRRYTLRDPKLKQRFDEHVDEAGTYIPAWLSPAVRKQRSQEAFDVAMKVAREQGFAQAAPLFEGVRGDYFPQAQIAIAVYELRELGDKASALRRLNDVIQVAPRNIAARMQRARILMRETSRRVEAATDYLIVLREVSRGDGEQEAAEEVSHTAIEKLWELHAEFASKKKLEQALALVNEDPERGYEAVSRYVHTHPCSWDAQLRLAGLALAKERFDVVMKLLSPIRWLFPKDPRPHFMYGQALASRDLLVPAVRALEHAASLAPNDPDIERWLRFARGDGSLSAGMPAAPVAVAQVVARSLLVMLGFVREGRVVPAVMVLHRLPGDLSLGFVFHAIAAQEKRRFSGGREVALTGEVDLRAIGRRSSLTDYTGEPLHPDQTVGDVPDPGVVVAILYDEAEVAAAGRFNPLPEPCREALLRATQEDAALATKLVKHMESPEARLLARLDR